MSLEQKVFTAGRFKDHDSSVRFYTGFANWRTFIATFNYLNPGRNGENIKYWCSDLSQRETSDDNNTTMPMENKPELGIQINLKPKPLDKFIVVMCRLRQGFHEEHLANLFGVSTATIGHILISWINFMYLKLGQLNIWPSREAATSSFLRVLKRSIRIWDSVMPLSQVGILNQMWTVCAILCNAQPNVIST